MRPLDNGVLYNLTDWLYRRVFRCSFQDRRCRQCGERRFEHRGGELRKCRAR